MEIIKKIIAFILSILIIFSITININDISANIPFTDSINFMQSNSVVWIILLLFLYFIIEYCLKIKEKRLIICSGILSIILTIMYVIGNIIDTYLDFGIVLSNKNLFLFYFI